MNKVTITVTGIAGSGKSGIAHGIEMFLQANGLKATYINQEHLNTEERTDKVIAALIQNGTEITIIEEQANRA